MDHIIDQPNMEKGSSPKNFSSEKQSDCPRKTRMRQNSVTRRGLPRPEEWTFTFVKPGQSFGSLATNQEKPGDEPIEGWRWAGRSTKIRPASLSLSARRTFLKVDLFTDAKPQAESSEVSLSPGKDHVRYRRACSSSPQRRRSPKYRNGYPEDGPYKTVPVPFVDKRELVNKAADALQSDAKEECAGDKGEESVERPECKSNVSDKMNNDSPAAYEATKPTVRRRSVRKLPLSTQAEPASQTASPDNVLNSEVTTSWAAVENANKTSEDESEIAEETEGNKLKTQGRIDIDEWGFAGRMDASTQVETRSSWHRRLFLFWTTLVILGIFTFVLIVELDVSVLSGHDISRMP